MLEIHRLRAALKYGIAAVLAGAYAVSRGDILFIWYPILAVVMCMDETDTRVMAASRARLLGTITAGVVSFLVHTILSGWIGLTVALLIVVPLLRLLGWQSSFAIAVLVCSMLFLVAGYFFGYSYSILFSKFETSYPLNVLTLGNLADNLFEVFFFSNRKYLSNSPLLLGRNIWIESDKPISFKKET